MANAYAMHNISLKYSQLRESLYLLLLLIIVFLSKGINSALQLRKTQD